MRKRKRRGFTPKSLGLGGHRQTRQLGLQLVCGFEFRSTEVAARQVGGPERNHGNKKECEPTLQFQRRMNRGPSTFGAGALHLSDGLLFAADAKQEKHTRSLL